MGHERIEASNWEIVLREMRPYFGSQFVDQLCLHILIVVRDVKHDDTLACQCVAQLKPHSVQVRLLHCENDIRPANVALGDDNPGIRLSPRRTHLESRDACEYRLGGKAAKAIPAAHKQQFCFMSLGHVRRCDYAWNRLLGVPDAVNRVIAEAPNEA